MWPKGSDLGYLRLNICVSKDLDTKRSESRKNEINPHPPISTRQKSSSPPINYIDKWINRFSALHLFGYSYSYTPYLQNTWTWDLFRPFLLVEPTTTTTKTAQKLISIYCRIVNNVPKKHVNHQKIPDHTDNHNEKENRRQCVMFPWFWWNESYPMYIYRFQKLGV